MCVFLEIENASLPNTARANTEILVGGKTEGNAKEQPGKRSTLANSVVIYASTH